MRTTDNEECNDWDDPSRWDDDCDDCGQWDDDCGCGR